MQDFIIRRAYRSKRITGILSVIIFCYFLIKIAASWALLRSNISTGKAVILLFLVFLSFALLRILHTLLHELGHMIFGKIVGFQLISFQLYRYLFVPRMRSINKLGKKNITYQTNMKPKEKDKAYKYVIYSLGGCLITAIALICVSITGFKEKGTLVSIMKYVFLYEGIVSVVRNMLPNYHGEYGNDGFNAYCLGKYKSMRQSFYYQCMLYQELLSGKSPYNVTLGIEAITVIKDNYNIFSYYPSVYLYYKCIDSNKLKEALECLKIIKEHEVLFGQQIRNKIWLEELYFRCMTEKDFSITEEELNKLKTMAKSGSVEVVRVYHAICKYTLKDINTSLEYEKAVQKVSPDFMQGLYHFQQRLIIKSDLYKHRFTSMYTDCD